MNGKVEKKIVPKQALKSPTQSFGNSKLRLGCNNSVGSFRRRPNLMDGRSGVNGMPLDEKEDEMSY